MSSAGAYVPAHFLRHFACAHLFYAASKRKLHSILNHWKYHTYVNSIHLQHKIAYDAEYIWVTCPCLYDRQTIFLYIIAPQQCCCGYVQLLKWHIGISEFGHYSVVKIRLIAQVPIKRMCYLGKFSGVGVKSIIQCCCQVSIYLYALLTKHIPHNCRTWAHIAHDTVHSRKLSRYSVVIYDSYIFCLEKCDIPTTVLTIDSHKQLRIV